MLSKNSTLAVFTLVLIGVSVILFNVQPTKASGTIYIRADGSVDPPTAPIISSDNITYTFNADINDSIVVERSNITIDGNGYTLQGSGNDSGLTIGDVDDVIGNVTIRNINIKNFSTGIQVIRSSSNTISESNITDNGCGIRLSGSPSFVPCVSNTISGNSIRDNGVGISLDGGSWDHKIYHNSFIDNRVQAEAYADPHHEYDPATASWNSDCEGNYWSNYNGADLNGDGIGDAPYVINENNNDRYPLMNPYWSPCDINHDLKLDMEDINSAAAAFGSKPDSKNWNCQADITGPTHLKPDSKVDIRDIALIARNFGKKHGQTTEIRVVNPQTGDANFEFYTNSTFVESRFNATLIVYDVEDLYLFQACLKYNSSVIQPTRAWIPEDDAEYVFYAENSVSTGPYFYQDDPIYGTSVLVGSTLLGTVNGFNGTGLLAIIEFEVDTEPNVGEAISCILNIENEETYLENSQLETIQVTKTNGHYRYEWAAPLTYLAAESRSLLVGSGAFLSGGLR